MFDESFVRRVRGDGFNTLYVSDTTCDDPLNAACVRLSARDVARVQQIARRYDMNVIVFIAAVESVPDAEQPDRRTNRYLTNDQLLARYKLWRDADRGAMIGVLLLSDDPFYLRVPVELQRGWAATLRQAGDDIPLLGLVGEFALATPAEEIAAFWDPATFDALVVVSYPYNLGYLWGRPLDHIASSDPDADVRAYEHDYIAALRERLPGTFSSERGILPVIQAFWYSGDGPGAVPRDDDIPLQIRSIHEELSEQLGQTQNTSIGVFFAGQSYSHDVLGLPKGVYDRPEWPAIVAAENARLAAQTAASAKR